MPGFNPGNGGGPNGAEIQVGRREDLHVREGFRRRGVDACDAWRARAGSGRT